MFYKATISELREAIPSYSSLKMTIANSENFHFAIMMNHELHAVILDLDHDEDLNAVFRQILFMLYILHVVLN